jgi:hypothetical protein
MPDWSIKIVHEAGATTFEPAQQNAWQDDLVTWNNTTDVTHQPWPTDQVYNPLPDSEVTRGSANYLSDPIPPHQSSRPSYNVQGSDLSPPPSSWTIYYCCKLHPNERGTIEATAVPTS